MSAPQFSILPIPAPLGADSNSVISEPQYLRIQPTSTKSWCLITDSYGRELISGKYNKSKVDFSLPGHAGITYRLRPKVNGFKRFFSESHTYILADAKGADVATFTPVDPGNVRNLGIRYYEIDCVNGLAKGDKVRLTLRGSLYSKECALMFGANPVVRVQRPQFMTAEERRALMVLALDPQDIYDAVVAPGTDLVWISMIMWCLDFLYAASNP